ncbi:MAG: hypothetical protein JW720_06570, partial [Sedimentisphaerales bacterium]|nr:hypothetical protein [Sedimentisphaerales bacterium]
MLLKVFDKLHSVIQARRISALRFARKGANVTLLAPLQIAFPEKCSLGSHIHIGPGAVLYTQGGLTIDDGVVIGPNFTVYTANHRYEGAQAVPYDGKVFLEPVHIGENVWIGGNVIVVPGVTIGQGAVV